MVSALFRNRSMGEHDKAFNTEFFILDFQHQHNKKELKNNIAS